MINVPNLLSGLRIVLVPVNLWLAWMGLGTAFLIVFTASLLSDLVDGYVARKLNQESELGAKLDSWGDFATYLSAPLCVWWLWPDLIRREGLYIAVLLASLLIPSALGFLKYGLLTSYHTYGAKLCSVLLGATGLLLLLDGPPLPFRIAVGVLVLAELEEVAITTLLPEWRSNVPTVWHARRLLRPPPATSVAAESSGEASEKRAPGDSAE